MKTPTFPEISTKSDLECRTVLDNQILVIDNILSVAECKAFVKHIDSLPLELTPPKKRGEAERHNHRISVTSKDFAVKLFSVLEPHLPLFLPMRGKKGAARAAHSCNSNIRMYKYDASQYFGQVGQPHYDDDCKDALTGDKSEWTLLIYLTGCEDGVEGGETVFYQGKQAVKPPLTRGTALLHRHGRECLLHEGSSVLKGTKYVLRSDIMFR
ncbi:Fe2OG dioxygenase domain-containing protein [Mycena indigotica]|uniref:Fe2OG dioxygenase domain-containing protein n=1 Tax=Mycena indigotica TaxID=2126181 RepID=A0A8H6VV54_9AGAR|nr:Fe2OG dioxygenase domain-containing protein [Mycena indigotica]KAF7295037.1 Fe2OG dioxygenase domain-containing protein [Mycena indigotica]